MVFRRTEMTPSALAVPSSMNVTVPARPSTVQLHVLAPLMVALPSGLVHHRNLRACNRARELSVNVSFLDQVSPVVITQQDRAIRHRHCT